MNRKLKLSLSLKFNDPNRVPNFVLNPSPLLVTNTETGQIAIFEVDYSLPLVLSVTVTQVEQNAALIIESIVLGNTPLSHIDTIGQYKTSLGIKKTYGYMDEPGTYKFKIRYNAISQNYISFLLNNS